MITNNSYLFAYQLSARLGPAFDVFCFSGVVPQTIEEIPFNLYVDLVEPLNSLGYAKTLDSVSLYNNMVCRLKANATSTASTGYGSVEFIQSTNVEPGLTKASYQDLTVNAFRHIPQTIQTDLIKYETYANNQYTTGVKNFACVWWPEGNTDRAFFKIPAANKNDGFFVECDFEYEAGITTINIVSNGSNSFSGNLVIQRWDPALNTGAGDWVDVHTYTMVETSTTNNIVLPSEIISTKVRLNFASADSNATITLLQTIEFLGSSPVDTLPSVDPVTWALIVPTRPVTGAFDSIVPQTPCMIATAGGPSEDVELKINKKTPDAGRTSSIVACKMQFLMEEF